MSWLIAIAGIVALTVLIRGVLDKETVRNFTLIGKIAGGLVIAVILLAIIAQL